MCNPLQYYNPHRPTKETVRRYEESLKKAPQSPAKRPSVESLRNPSLDAADALVGVAAAISLADTSSSVDASSSASDYSSGGGGDFGGGGSSGDW